MKTLTLNKQISVSKEVSIISLELDIQQFDDCGSFTVNAIASLNTNVEWMQLPTQIMRNIESVTKSLLVESFPSLKDVKVTFSEQGRQFRDAMDMDVFFEKKSPEGFRRWDEKRNKQVFANI